MNNQTKKRPERRNASEVLTVFLGFLSQREKPLILSTRHDFAPVVEYASKFMDVNRMPKIRDYFPKLKPPPNTNHLTNEPTQTMNQRPLSPDEILNIIQTHLGMLDHAQQNKLIARVLGDMKRERTTRVAYHKDEAGKVAEIIRDADQSAQDFQNILNGQFSML